MGSFEKPKGKRQSIISIREQEEATEGEKTETGGKRAGHNT